MITWILAALIIGSAAYIIYKKIKKMKAGDFSCEGCKRKGCSGCESEKKSKKNEL